MKTFKHLAVLCVLLSALALPARAADDGKIEHPGDAPPAVVFTNAVITSITPLL